MQLGRGDGHIELKARATLGGPKRQDSHHPPDVAVASHIRHFAGRCLLGSAHRQRHAQVFATQLVAAGEGGME